MQSKRTIKLYQCALHNSNTMHKKFKMLTFAFCLLKLEIEIEHIKQKILSLHSMSKVLQIQARDSINRRQQHMSKYTIMPEGCKWTECVYENELDAKQVYSMNAHWYKPGTRIAILNNGTGQTHIFTRTIDSNGNLLEVNEV